MGRAPNKGPKVSKKIISIKLAKEIFVVPCLPKPTLIEV